MKKISLCYLTLFSILFALGGCARKPVIEPEKAMRPVEDAPRLSVHKEESESFFELVQQTSSRLRQLSPRKMVFGSCEMSSHDYAHFLDEVSTVWKKDGELPRELYRPYEVYGKEEWGEILLTSYFSPVYQARHRPEGPYTQPVYALPQDLIEVSLSQFSHEDLAELETDRPVVSARLVDKIPLARVVPYYSREEIDIEGVLKGRGLELAYMDPIEAFFLQIQGSGTLVFKGGERLSLGYAAQNGFRYRSIGKLLYDVIPKEEMSLYRIEKYLRTLSKEELYDFLKQNPSYVFFTTLKGDKGVTTFGLEVVDRRTLAIDSSLFPLGALALLEYPHPHFDSDEQETQVFQKRQRLVFSHDTGGAIKGPGRADLYWGSGREARRAAGIMKYPAKLWFLAPSSCSP